MNDLIHAILAETAVDRHAPSEVARPLVEAITALLPVQIMVAVGLAGLALLIAGLLNARTTRASALLNATPTRSVLLGGGALLVLAVVTLIAAKAGPGRGGMIAGFLLMTAIAAGLAATARAIGDRLSPDAGILARTCIGLAACCLPLALPLGLGLPATAGAAALGLGAMLRAGRPA